MVRERVECINIIIYDIIMTEEFEAIVNPKTGEVYFKGKKTGKTKSSIRSSQPANFQPAAHGGPAPKLNTNEAYYTPYGKHHFVTWKDYGIGGVGMIAEFKPIEANWLATGSSCPHTIYVGQWDVCITDTERDSRYSDISILKAQEDFHGHQGGTIGRIYRFIVVCVLDIIW